MNNTIKVYCENIAATVDVQLGTPLLEVAKGLELKLGYAVLAAYVNNRIKELNYRVHTPVSVRFIDISHPEGHRVYQRTVAFLLQQADPARKIAVADLGCRFVTHGATAQLYTHCGISAADLAKKMMEVQANEN